MSSKIYWSKGLTTMLMGLSAACFSVTAQAATVIQPVAVTASSSGNEGFGSAPINLINGAGLDPTPGDILTKNHNQNLAGEWMTGVAPFSDQWLIFDLGDVYQLSALHVWNGAEYGQTFGDLSDRGLRAVALYADVANPDPTTFVQGLEFQMSPAVVPTSFSVTGGVASGADYNIPGVTYQLDNVVNARYVKFAIASNWGGSALSLAEVRFIAIPEPSSIILLTSLGLGSCLLALRKKVAQVLNSLGL